MYKKSAFTLIELMIVIAIIAIIAAIAVPSLIKSKISANESAAAAALKTFHGMMATFRRKGYNGARSYPAGAGTAPNAGKYCGLYYEVNNAGDRITLIGVADANADGRAHNAGSGPWDGAIGSYVPVIKTTQGPVYQFPTTFVCQPKQGYWFLLLPANAAGFSYLPSVARHRYAMGAGPEEYGSSGEAMFLINEEGTVYTLDMGEPEIIAFPGPDPIANGWEVAQ